ncbi:MAG: hypothetical protein HQL29_01040 [Candidatus Omnitrophica bacterium]|nr:hypothetical protein [Candidatus Omnitrophota bacterium]
MKILLSALIAVFVLSSCANVEMYTFKKERVDQGLEGNEGYIGKNNEAAPEQNEAAPVQKEERKTKRTLLGIDIELPFASADGEDEETAVKQPVTKETAAKPQVAKTPEVKAPATKVETKKIVAETVVVDQDSKTEEWVK